ncbi:MAG TPA: urea amidolyase associated protein UAAP2 [Burkholderiaceae bacterium]
MDTPVPSTSPSTRDPARAVRDEVVAAGEPWLARIARGQVLRIVDLEGNQAVDTLFFNAQDPAEHYSLTHTIQRQRALYLGLGTTLFSSDDRPMLTIVADTCGRHDTLGGACSCESNTVRYGLGKRFMHSCRDSFMTAIVNDPSGQLTKAHLSSNINFFMNVPVSPTGGLAFADGISGAGKYVELEAHMDVTVLISNCPQLNNPCNAYDPTPVRCLVWDAE